MAALSKYWKKQIYDALFKSTAVALPSQLWIGLHATDPGDTGTGELGSSFGYARIQLNPDANNTTVSHWSAVDQSQVLFDLTNAVDLTGPVAVGGDWNGGNAIPFATLWEAGSGGNFVARGTISGGGVTVRNTQAVVIPAGFLHFQLD